jgi:hypothetical protein
VPSDSACFSQPRPDVNLPVRSRHRDPHRAESIDADVVGADRAAFERLGRRYLRFR